MRVVQATLSYKTGGRRMLEKISIIFMFIYGLINIFEKDRVKQIEGWVFIIVIILINRIL